MKIIEYNNKDDIMVEFQDEYKAKIHTNFQAFSKGVVKNPYYSSIYGIGIIGIKYPSEINGRTTKEYDVWHSVIQRCFDVDYQEKQPTYKVAKICDEWLLYDNFYEWLHNQGNFDKWFNGERWAIDKDILVKGNKIYSPDTCCLVPQNINSLFTNRKNYRGNLPIGVKKHGNKFVAQCMNPFTNNNKQEYLGIYTKPEKAFYVYKNYKEDIIKRVANLEYSKGNITKQCYDAMMKYEIEITD